ncbi:MAG: transposase [bacterium]|nr:transposase [bacterium]
MAESSLDITELNPDELKALLVQALEEISSLKKIIQEQRDEIARLKGLNEKPKLKPSGMEKEARPRSGKKGRKKRRGRGRKNDKLKINETKILKPDNLPEGSVFKGYEDYLVQDLIIMPWTVRYRRGRWKTPDGRTIVADLPEGIQGGFGPNIRRFVLSQYHLCRVTLPLLTKQMHDFGMIISQRSIGRFLNDNNSTFLDEASGILYAGLKFSDWVTTDDTGARHKAKNGYCTQIGNNYFAWFKTSFSKSRLNYLEILRAGDESYEINQAALDYLGDRGLPKKIIEQLAAHKTKCLADQKAWLAHLKKLKIKKSYHKRIASEGACWGRITTMGLLEGTVIISDGAGQFRVGDHASCWVHAERLVHALETFCEKKCKAKERIRSRIWWLYADIKEYQDEPTKQRKYELRRRFKNIFSTKTGFVTLDRLLERLLAKKDEMLRVLERPEIPLHTNGSENDIRASVIKRMISGGTRSDQGRDCRDAFLSLMKTCAKLGLSFWDYLGHRLSVPGATEILPLPDLIHTRATA